LEIIHVPGRENIGADTLTRHPQSPTEELPTYTRTIVINKLALLEYSNEVQEQFKNLEVLQQQDEHIQKLKQRLKQGINHNLMMHQNLLFRQAPSGEYQIMVPAIAVRLLVEETHKIYGHCGTYKTYKLVQQNHQFKNMYRTIKQIIKTCDLCQKAKINNITARGPTLSLLPTEPREMVSADLMGPLPRGQGGC